MVHTNPEQNFPLWVYAFHLHKLLTNPFFHVNKQSLLLEIHLCEGRVGKGEIHPLPQTLF